MPADSCASFDQPATVLRHAPQLSPSRFAHSAADAAVNSSNVIAYINALGNVEKKEYMRRDWYIHHTVSPYLIWWFTRLQHSLRIFGAVGEIGVQYGGFFLAIATSSAIGEQPYAIDIFNKQQLNLDSSGRGAWKHFRNNLEALHFKGHLLHAEQLSRAAAQEPKAGSKRGARRVVAIQMRSSDITLAALSRVIPQPTRLLSVDGGHSRESTCHDLNLAAAHMHDGGIIIVDDVGCCNQEHTWGLGVIDGLASFYAGPGRHELVPFFYFFPKLYLAKRAYADRYRAAMAADPVLNSTLRLDVGNAVRDRTRGRSIPMHASRYTLFGGEVLRAGMRPAEALVRDVWLAAITHQHTAGQRSMQERAGQQGQGPLMAH